MPETHKVKVRAVVIHDGPLELNLESGERIVSVETGRASGAAIIWIADDRYDTYVLARDAVETECKGGCDDRY